MKKHFTLIVLSLITASAVAQVQNPSFETWTSGSPSSWTSTNVGGLLNNVQESNDAHAGSKAADLVVGSFNGSYLGGIVFQQDVPYTGSAQNMTVWYKGVLNQDAFLVLTVTYSDANDNVLYTGVGSYFNSAANYTAAVVVPQLVTAGTIAKMGLTISLSLSSNNSAPAGNPHVIVDDVQFGGTVGTNELNPIVSNVSVFPNPAEDNCTLSVNSNVNTNSTVAVYDLQGRLILSENKLITIGLNQFSFDLSSLTNGIYSIVLDSNGQRTTKLVVKQ